MEDFTDFICYRLKSTMKKLEKHITHELSKFGVNLPQSFVLFSLLENDGSTLSEIGNRAQIENSSLTTIVDKLEKEALVERRMSAQDRRVIRLFLTDKGRSLAEELLSAGSSFNHYLISELDTKQKDFIQGLTVVTDSIDTI